MKKCAEVVKPVPSATDYWTNRLRGVTDPEGRDVNPDTARPEETMMDELHDKHVEIDERWLSEWFEFGFAELSSYLAKHAAFDDYCHRHELD